MIAASLPAKSCKAQIRDILLASQDWIVTHEIMAKIPDFTTNTVRNELALLHADKMIDKDGEGRGHWAKYRANGKTETIKNATNGRRPTGSRASKPHEPSTSDQICAILLKHGKPMTKAQILPLVERVKKTGISSYLTTLHHAGWIGYTPQAVGNSGTFWANERTASYASRGAQPRAKREVLQDAEPQDPAFKPMYATAIALPRGMPSFTPLPRQTWEPPRGLDPVIKSRGF